MDIFKLIFEHDLRLDSLRERHLDRKTPEVSSSIEDFMKPDPTYSKFYISGTRLDKKKFGLNRLEKSHELLKAIQTALDDYSCYKDREKVRFEDEIGEMSVGSPLVFTKADEPDWNSEELEVDDNTNVGHMKTELANVLNEEHLVLYKEKAHDGFDLHLFSKKNVYRDLFYPLQELIDDSFRFFSINGRRIRSERKFYFETWTLEQPPHGVEEVFPDTEL